MTIPAKRLAVGSTLSVCNGRQRLLVVWATCYVHSARRLGIPPDASFEEVQDARNFLYEVSQKDPGTS